MLRPNLFSTRVRFSLPIRLLGGVVMLLALTPEAGAHDIWINKQKRLNTAGEWCCNTSDCSKVSAQETPRGYLFSTGEEIPRTEIMLSGDGDFWVCRRPDRTIRCAFAPLGS